jgi:glycosyltransferase involved in cell wall biosynthesis
MANKNIVFKGFLSSQKYAHILSLTHAYIHASPDDPFPMAPLEAMSMGLPVIGYYGGGLKEIIIEGKTGLFFYKPTPESLNATIQKMQTMSFDPEVCKRHAKQFSEKIFVKNFKNMIMSEYETFASAKNSNHS